MSIVVIGGTNMGIPSVVGAGGGTVIVVPGAIFDGLTGRVNMSNGLKTATRADTTVNAGGAVSLSLKTANKYYLEFNIGVTTNNSSTWGVALSTATFLQLSQGNNCSALTASGNVYSNNGNSTLTTGAPANGDVISCAIDLDNRKSWFRRNGGNWNGQTIGLQNPATATGGVVIAAGSFSPCYGNGTATPSLTENTTINANQASFAFPVPSGFVNWPLN